MVIESDISQITGDTQEQVWNKPEQTAINFKMRPNLQNHAEEVKYTDIVDDQNFQSFKSLVERIFIDDKIEWYRNWLKKGTTTLRSEIEY